MTEQSQDSSHIYLGNSGAAEPYLISLETHTGIALRYPLPEENLSPEEATSLTSLKYTSHENLVENINIESVEGLNSEQIAHAQELATTLKQIVQEGQLLIASRNAEIKTGTPGLYVEFEVSVEQSEAIQKLQNRREMIELVAVRPSGNEIKTFTATVFVPIYATDYYQFKIGEYLLKRTPKGNPRNKALIANIRHVQLATVKSLFTDNLELFPVEEGQTIWWEVWLRKGSKRDFQKTAAGLNIRVKEHSLSLPEREIVLALADLDSLTRLIQNSSSVAELRIPKDSPSFFLEDLNFGEREEWVKAFLSSNLVPPSGDAISVCLLDGGVTQKHPLIEPALDTKDMHSYQESWGTHDTEQNRHGTRMSGIALYADLVDALATPKIVPLSHRLESVKILPPNNQKNGPESYGIITSLAVALVEGKAPDRKRVLCMAVSNDADQVDGRPSTWSTAIDQICFGQDDLKRLMIISAGNIRQDLQKSDYLNLNDLEPIEDPGQAWNPIVVGAYTDKVYITNPMYRGWAAVAQAGNLSPRSRTSILWNSQWPTRPDVVFEGGNYATNGQEPLQCLDELCLLTTYDRYKLFAPMSDTSCATALCSYMAARIMSKYPNYWAETIRALIIHSADWTKPMKSCIRWANHNTKRTLLRRYGYGVPNLEQTLGSTKNNLTFVVEDRLSTLQRSGNGFKPGELKFHKIPLPLDQLQQLENTKVEFRVTLSYFIEPNLESDRILKGWRSYASHGLRFAFKYATETHDKFRARIIKAIRMGRESSSTENYQGWFLRELRNCGSIHSDLWQGPAAELVKRDEIVVYPVSGWWKTDTGFDEWIKIARYSLIISIRLPEGLEANIYTETSSNRVNNA